jgi:hypothetical protein
MTRLVLVAVLFAALGASRPAQDELASARYFVGTWTCGYQAGSTHVVYKATFAYVLGGNFLRERDTWTGGGSDEAYFTYDPKERAWTYTVFENERTTTIFVGHGNASHISYRSVYPNANATEKLDEITPTRYVLHFTAYVHGKSTAFSTDTCTKDLP